MVISQFTEDRPSFLSALIYLVFRTTICHMDYFYSPDADRHREVKLLKVMNSAEWGGGGVHQTDLWTPLPSRSALHPTP